MNGNAIMKDNCGYYKTVCRKICLRFMFALFALKPNGKLETGQTELYIIGYLTELSD